MGCSLSPETCSLAISANTNISFHQLPAHILVLLILPAVSRMWHQAHADDAKQINTFRIYKKG